MTVKEMQAFYSLLEKQYTRGYRDGQDAQAKEGYIQNCDEQVNNFELRILELTEELAKERSNEKIEDAETRGPYLRTGRSKTSHIFPADEPKVSDSGVASKT